MDPTARNVDAALIHAARAVLPLQPPLTDRDLLELALAELIQRRRRDLALRAELDRIEAGHYWEQP